ncbi:MAG: pantoate--beta-alanine ligase [Actinomycetota bacterium]|nr:pantoate--beta-alanine ligase [Actinomycetota bacterium]
MLVIETIEGFRRALDAERGVGRTVGLVPTMGSLHDGHLSLVRRAVAECEVVAVTVFVNPLQFTTGEDLASYPRDLEGDTSVASAAGVEYLFAPSVREMYPDGMLTSVAVSELSEGLEGSARPGHFTGVATVVAKLFAIAGPCRAYFGEKDHQQLAVVRRLVADLSFPVQVVACPTVREADGLALSSRNLRLSGDERRAAAVLHRALLAGRALLEAGEDDADVVGAAMAEHIAGEPSARADYAEAREEDGDWRLLVAAWFGATRLIDNLAVPGRARRRASAPPEGG